jgi:hypothetical protein
MGARYWKQSWRPRNSPSSYTWLVKLDLTGTLWPDLYTNAVKSGRVSTVEMVMSWVDTIGRDRITHPDPPTTCAELAAACGYLEIVKLLAQKGCLPHDLCGAVRHGRYDVLTFLNEIAHRDSTYAESVYISLHAIADTSWRVFLLCCSEEFRLLGPNDLFPMSLVKLREAPTHIIGAAMERGNLGLVKEAFAAKIGSGWRPGSDTAYQVTRNGDVEMLRVVWEWMHVRYSTVLTDITTRAAYYIFAILNGEHLMKAAVEMDRVECLKYLHSCVSECYAAVDEWYDRFEQGIPSEWRVAEDWAYSGMYQIRQIRKRAPKGGLAPYMQEIGDRAIHRRNPYMMLVLRRLGYRYTDEDPRRFLPVGSSTKAGVGPTIDSVMLDLVDTFLRGESVPTN